MGTETDAGGDDREFNLNTFANSVLFTRTFDEGMSLVEETARYLDGRGRDEARALPRKLALLYASESMRVTTRLMQAASWLLIQRAVHDGDMRAEDAARERYRLGSKEICLGGREVGVDALPKTLQELLRQSESLYRRIARLDDILFGTSAEPASGIQRQLSLLRQSFDSTGTDGVA